MSQVTDYVQGVASSITNSIGVWARRTINGDVQGVLVVDTDGSDNVTYSPLAKDATLTSGTALIMNREVASSFNTNQVTVTSTATLIHALTTTRNLLTVRNIGSADMYIGGPAVTTATGFLLHSGESQDVKATGAVYGITVASTTTTANYYEEVL